MAGWSRDGAVRPGARAQPSIRTANPHQPGRDWRLGPLALGPEPPYGPAVTPQRSCTRSDASRVTASRVCRPAAGHAAIRCPRWSGPATTLLLPGVPIFFKLAHLDRSTPRLSVPFSSSDLDTLVGYAPGQTAIRRTQRHCFQHRQLDRPLALDALVSNRTNRQFYADALPIHHGRMGIVEAPTPREAKLVLAKEPPTLIDLIRSETEDPCTRSLAKPQLRLPKALTLSNTIVARSDSE